MSYLDKTFCASPDCKNECGRKMTDDERAKLDKLNDQMKQRMAEAFHGRNKEPIFMTGVSYGYFCDESEE